MVNCARRPLIRAAAPLALLVVLLAGFRDAPQTEGLPAEAFPVASAGQATPEVLVRWVVRTSDLLACQQLTPELRRMQHQYRERVTVIAHPIGADTVLLRSFLRRERLVRVVVEPISERDFRRDIAHRLQAPVSTPALIVSYRGTREQAFDVALGTTVGRRGIPEFAAYVTGLLQPGRVAGKNSISTNDSGDEL